MLLTYGWEGSQQMDEMIAAVYDINEASKSVSNIMETINDIATQTNLVALNAAIEAARAGEQGKGFAVVAEEVRKFVAQSEEAVKETSVIVNNSMQKAELGARVAGEMAASLTELLSVINESPRFVSEIAKATEEQNANISQITFSINQVSDIVKYNRVLADESAKTAQDSAAAFEESAAAADDMNNQAAILKDLTSHFIF